MADVTEAKLAEWERLAEAATPGPWWVTGQPWGDETSVHAGPSDDPHTMTFPVCDFDLMSHQFGDAFDGTDSDDIPEMVAPNMALIAAARQAVPALIAEVRRLREENVRLDQLVCDFQAASMLEVGRQGGPCCVEPRHVERHITELRDALRPFAKGGDSLARRAREVLGDA